MWGTIRRYIIVTIGAFILAFGIAEFLLPNRLAVGGVSGVSTILYYLFGFPVGVLVFILNIPIFIIGTVSEGKSFLAKSLYGTFMLSFFLQIMENLRTPNYDFFLSAVYGGLLSGVGIGVALLGGGTTGGTDIVAKVLNKKMPHLSIGVFVLIIDAIVIAAAMLAFRDLNVGLYSAVALFISAKAVDFCTQGLSFTKTVFIISDEAEEIAQTILEKMKRGVTALFGSGVYSGSNKTILLCTMHKSQISKLRKIVKMIDSRAFVITTDSREVYGKGFTQG